MTLLQPEAVRTLADLRDDDGQLQAGVDDARLLLSLM